MSEKKVPTPFEAWKQLQETNDLWHEVKSYGYAAEAKDSVPAMRIYVQPAVKGQENVLVRGDEAAKGIANDMHELIVMQFRSCDNTLERDKLFYHWDNCHTQDVFISLFAQQ